MVIIGSDHSGIDLKKKIIKYLCESNIEYLDVTDYDNQDGDDYPDIAHIVCKNVLNDSKNRGIAICGTGIGISIACNKIVGIRAAVCTDSYMASMCRKDNDANVLCLGARLDLVEKCDFVIDIVDKYLNTTYDGGRHQRRLNKIEALEKQNLIEGGSKWQ